MIKGSCEECVKRTFVKIPAIAIICNKKVCIGCYHRLKNKVFNDFKKVRRKEIKIKNLFYKTNANKE